MPNGIPGAETRLPILWSKGVVEGRITANEFGALTSTNHAKMYGLYPHKGSIAVGFDADLVLWDANRKEVIRQELCTRFLDAHPEFVCVVGPICDQFPSDNGYAYRARDRIWNMCLDETGRGLVLIPIAFMPPADIMFDGEHLQRCDFGPNWGVFRRSFFIENALRWDEQFKIGGEHFDFFLRLKLHPARPRLAYWPKLQCDHMRGMDESYAQVRRRLNWRKEFRAKWDLRYRCVVGNLQMFESDLRSFDTWSSPPPVDSPPVLKLEQQLQQSQDTNEELRRRIAGLQDRLANTESGL